MQTKEKYITPEIEIIEFESEDIIITSNGDQNGSESLSGVD